MAKTLEDAATKGAGNTALGLAIGALGLKLLPNILGWSGEGGELDLFGAPRRGYGHHGHGGHNHDWELQREIFGTTVGLQGGIYQSRIDALQGDYQSLLYTDKKYEQVEKQICDLKEEVAVLKAVKPYEQQITDMKIKESEVKAAYDLDRRTCRMISGEVVLPLQPEVTGVPSYYRPCCNAAVAPPQQQ